GSSGLSNVGQVISSETCEGVNVDAEAGPFQLILTGCIPTSVHAETQTDIRENDKICETKEDLDRLEDYLTSDDQKLKLEKFLSLVAQHWQNCEQHFVPHNIQRAG
ncbi:unnamed protein product, partial [Allacma fusca]